MKFGRRLEELIASCSAHASVHPTELSLLVHTFLKINGATIQNSARFVDAFGSDRQLSPLQLAARLEPCGVTVRAYRKTQKDLHDIKGYPIINLDGRYLIHLEATGVTHLVFDPATGIRRITKHELADQWDGGTLEIQEVLPVSAETTTKPKPGTLVLGELFKRKRMLSHFVCLWFLSALVDIFIPVFTQNTVNALDLISGTAVVWRLGAVLTLLAIGNLVLSFLCQNLYAEFGNNLEVSLGTKIFKQILELDLKDHSRHDIGFFTARLNRAASLSSTVLFQLTVAAAEIPTFLTYVLVIALVDIRCGLVALLLVPVVGVSAVVSNRLIARATSLRLKIAASSSNQIQEGIANLDVIKCFQAEERLIERYKNSWREYLPAAIRTQQHQRLLQAVQSNLAVWIALIGCAMTGARLVEGTLKGGDVILLIYGFSGLIYPINQIFNFLGSMQTLAAFNISIAEIQASNPRPAFRPQATPAPSSLVPAVAMENVSFCYEGSRDFSIENLTLKIAYGEWLAIVGASGSGKSTFADLASGLLTPQTGTIQILGKQIDGGDRAAAFRAIRRVDQASELFSGTIERNVAVFDDAPDLARVAACLNVCELSAVVADRSNGVATDIGELGKKLSGGEKQRLAFARSLYSPAPIYILDEVSAHLDPHTEAVMFSNLKKQLGDETVISITHRENLLHVFDRIIFFNNGRIADQGSHADLKERNPAYTALFKAHQESRAA